MGLFSRFNRPAIIEAQYAPPVMADTYQYQIPYNLLSIDRISAMSIPAVNRCRNLICNTIAAMELSLELKKSDINFDIEKIGEIGSKKELSKLVDKIGSSKFPIGGR